MRYKYNIGELVCINGIGKVYGKVKNKLGFIIEKDIYYNEYYVELISLKQKDWFKEKEIRRVLGQKKNKTERYQIRLCTTKEGYRLIEKNLKDKEPISNNKLNQVNIYKEYKINDKEYIIIGWYSVFWPISNKSIQIIENTVNTFRRLDIPFQYIVLNEENLTDIKIHEFIENDSNVEVFFIERRIRLKKLNKKNHENGRKDKNDSTKNVKCNV